jgi:DNA replicative helicase MCM subunit Mcm2 (Cdc46/Mcm family)
MDEAMTTMKMKHCIKRVPFASVMLSHFDCPFLSRDAQTPKSD